MLRRRDLLYRVGIRFSCRIKSRECGPGIGPVIFRIQKDRFTNILRPIAICAQQLHSDLFRAGIIGVVVIHPVLGYGDVGRFGVGDGVGRIIISSRIPLRYGFYNIVSKFVAVLVILVQAGILPDPVVQVRLVPCWFCRNDRILIRVAHCACQIAVQRQFHRFRAGRVAAVIPTLDALQLRFGRVVVEDSSLHSLNTIFVVDRRLQALAFRRRGIPGKGNFRRKLRIVVDVVLAAAVHLADRIGEGLSAVVVVIRQRIKSDFALRRGGLFLEDVSVAVNKLKSEPLRYIFAGSVKLFNGRKQNLCFLHSVDDRQLRTVVITAEGNTVRREAGQTLVSGVRSKDALYIFRPGCVRSALREQHEVVAGRRLDIAFRRRILNEIVERIRLQTGAAEDNLAIRIASHRFFHPHRITGQCKIARVGVQHIDAVEVERRTGQRVVLRIDLCHGQHAFGAGNGRAAGEVADLFGRRGLCLIGTGHFHCIGQFNRFAGAQVLRGHAVLDDNVLVVRQHAGKDGLAFRIGAEAEGSHAVRQADVACAAIPVAVALIEGDLADQPGLTREGIHQRQLASGIRQKVDAAAVDMDGVVDLIRIILSAARGLNQVRTLLHQDGFDIFRIAVLADGDAIVADRGIVADRAVCHRLAVAVVGGVLAVKRRAGDFGIVGQGIDFLGQGFVGPGQGLAVLHRAAGGDFFVIIPNQHAAQPNIVVSVDEAQAIGQGIGDGDRIARFKVRQGFEVQLHGPFNDLAGHIFPVRRCDRPVCTVLRRVLFDHVFKADVVFGFVVFLFTIKFMVDVGSVFDAHAVAFQCFSHADGRPVEGQRRFGGIGNGVDKGAVHGIAVLQRAKVDRNLVALDDRFIITHQVAGRGCDLHLLDGRFRADPGRFEGGHFIGKDEVFDLLALLEVFDLERNGPAGRAIFVGSCRAILRDADFRRDFCLVVVVHEIETGFVSCADILILFRLCIPGLFGDGRTGAGKAAVLPIIFRDGVDDLVTGRVIGKAANIADHAVIRMGHFTDIEGVGARRRKGQSAFVGGGQVIRVDREGAIRSNTDLVGQAFADFAEQGHIEIIVLHFVFALGRVDGLFAGQCQAAGNFAVGVLVFKRKVIYRLAAVRNERTLFKGSRRRGRNDFVVLFIQRNAYADVINVRIVGDLFIGARVHFRNAEIVVLARVITVGDGLVAITPFARLGIRRQCLVQGTVRHICAVGVHFLDLDFERAGRRLAGIAENRRDLLGAFDGELCGRIVGVVKPDLSVIRLQLAVRVFRFLDLPPADVQRVVRVCSDRGRKPVFCCIKLGVGVSVAAVFLIEAVEVGFTDVVTRKGERSAVVQLIQLNDELAVVGSRPGPVGMVPVGGPAVGFIPVLADQPVAVGQTAGRVILLAVHILGTFHLAGADTALERVFKIEFRFPFLECPLGRTGSPQHLVAVGNGFKIFTYPNTDPIAACIVDHGRAIDGNFDHFIIIVAVPFRDRDFGIRDRTGCRVIRQRVAVNDDVPALIAVRQLGPVFVRLDDLELQVICIVLERAAQYGLAALELDGCALVGIGKLEALLALRQPRDRRRQRAVLVFAHLDRDGILRLVIRHTGDRVLRRGFRKCIGIVALLVIDKAGQAAALIGADRDSLFRVRVGNRIAIQVFRAIFLGRKHKLVGIVCMPGRQRIAGQVFLDRERNLCLVVLVFKGEHALALGQLFTVLVTHFSRQLAGLLILCELDKEVIFVTVIACAGFVLV